MRVVVALGGNALVPPAEAGTRAASPAALAAAARVVAALAREHEVVVTHGNGPQVGLLALQARAWRPDEPERLDVLGAESEGLIGYMIERTLAPLVPGRAVATLLTQVEVAADDPAFARPTKPIGPFYDPADAARLARERGWTMGGFGGRARRLVASPAPLRILEGGVVRTLIAAGVIVICSGGGGIPVIVTDRGGVRGADAVIDKDRAAALLAETVEADLLLILTDVDAVYTDWPRPKGRPIRRASPDRLAAFSFAEGSMGPKVEAACRFVTQTGGRAAIGALGDGPAILAGTAGTQIASGHGVLELGGGAPAPGERYGTAGQAHRPRPGRRGGGAKVHGGVAGNRDAPIPGGRGDGVEVHGGTAGDREAPIPTRSGSSRRAPRGAAARPRGSQPRRP